jgi:hypothetical protein
MGSAPAVYAHTAAAQRALTDGLHDKLCLMRVVRYLLDVWIATASSNNTLIICRE